MANTLGDLKTRLIDETNRDDLGAGGALNAQFLLCLARAVEHHADEAFWFNGAAASADTAAGAATVSYPVTIRRAAMVSLGGCRLRKVALSDIETRSDTGVPSCWAANGSAIQIAPVPDATYTLSISGVAELGLPASDGESNAWTVQGQDLIAARTRFLLFRDVLRDTEGTQLAAQAEGEALDKLRRETRRRTSTPLQSTGDEPWTALGTRDMLQG